MYQPPNLRPWVENCCYPGTHWLLYDEKGEYVARVDLRPYDGGLYRWEAWMVDERRRTFGYAASLAEAQRMAQLVVMSRDVQLALF